VADDQREADGEARCRVAGGDQQHHEDQQEVSVVSTTKPPTPFTLVPQPLAPSVPVWSVTSPKRVMP
jgi:hypothetical protein